MRRAQVLWAMMIVILGIGVCSRVHQAHSCTVSHKGTPPRSGYITQSQDPGWNQIPGPGDALCSPPPEQTGHVPASPPLRSQAPAYMKAIVHARDQSERRQLVRGLTESVGPVEALALLKHSGLPYTGETHLLVHEIGEIAYQHYGHEALLHCTDDFLNACYHGVIIRALGDHGPDGVKRFLEQCRAAGTPTYHQCGHAIGHGYLAWKAYALLPALQLCDTLGGADAKLTLHCHVGVFMENIYGVHGSDPSAEKRSLSLHDPHYPCNAIPQAYRSGCYLNQASQMYRVFQGNLRKIAQACDEVTDTRHRGDCYDGLARLIHPMTDGNSEVVIKLCSHATGDWKSACLVSVAVAAQSVGDQELPFRLCAAVNDRTRQAKCFQAIGHNSPRTEPTPQRSETTAPAE